MELDFLDEIDDETIAETNEETEGFKIDTDAKAEWALRKIRRRKRILDRLLDLIDSQIKRLTERRRYLEEEYRIKTSSLIGMLYEYFRSLPADAKIETKTLRKYMLLSGCLIEKRERVEYTRDDKTFLAYLKRSGLFDFIKIEESPMWGEFKKLIKVHGNSVISPDGEIVEGVTALLKPAELEVVINDERL